MVVGIPLCTKKQVEPKKRVPKLMAFKKIRIHGYWLPCRREFYGKYVFQEKYFYSAVRKSDNNRNLH